LAKPHISVVYHSTKVSNGIVQMDDVINILFIYLSLLKIYQNYSREEFVLTTIITYVIIKCWNMKFYIVWFNQVCCKSEEAFCQLICGFKTCYASNLWLHYLTVWSHTRWYSIACFVQYISDQQNSQKVYNKLCTHTSHYKIFTCCMETTAETNPMI
jgi:hypothetical protein